MAHLFDTFKIKNLELKNRIVMAPMCMYQAKDGFVNEFHLIHYTPRAMGQTALILIEATAVTPGGRISKDDLGIWSDDHIEGLSILVKQLHQQGAKVGIQLAHAGRKSTVAYSRLLAPSPIAFSEDYREPEAMSQKDIDDTVVTFAEASRRAFEAGFDFIELHGAHGYLINTFCSPLTNHRTDRYGGDVEGRLTFLKEVITAVRKYWPSERPLGIRISAEEYHEDGLHPEDWASMLSDILPLGVDVINVSTGGTIPVAPNAAPGYQLPAAEIISRRYSGTAIIGGGLITKASDADAAIAQTKCDLVYLGRELLRNPNWPLLAAHELGVDILWPKCYERAKPH